MTGQPYSDEPSRCYAEGCLWGHGDEYGCGLAKIGIPSFTHLDEHCAAAIIVAKWDAEGFFR